MCRAATTGAGSARLIVVYSVDVGWSAISGTHVGVVVGIASGLSVVVQEIADAGYSWVWRGCAWLRAIIRIRCGKVLVWSLVVGLRTCGVGVVDAVEGWKGAALVWCASVGVLLLGLVLLWLLLLGRVLGSIMGMLLLLLLLLLKSGIGDLNATRLEVGEILRREMLGVVWMALECWMAYWGVAIAHMR